jgi:hypothetical protein
MKKLIELLKIIQEDLEANYRHGMAGIIQETIQILNKIENNEQIIAKKEIKMYNFKEVNICPKCRKNLILTPVQKVPEGRLISLKYCEPTLDVDKKNIIPEHLLIICDNCGYSWQERCADYKEKKN